MNRRTTSVIALLFLAGVFVLGSATAVFAAPSGEPPSIPAQFPGAAISVSPTKVFTGELVTVKGAGHPFVCAVDPVTAVVVLWDDTTEIARVSTLDAGAFSVRAKIPTRAKEGSHRISSWCAVIVTEDAVKLQLELADASVAVLPTAGDDSRPTLPTKVAGTSFPGPGARTFGGATDDTPSDVVLRTQPSDTVETAAETARSSGGIRSLFPSSLPSFGEALHSLRQVGVAAGFSLLLLLLIGFPSELFNNTLEEHHQRIFGRFAALRTRFRRAQSTWRRPGSTAPRLPSGVGFIAFAVAGGAIYSLLDPGLGWNQESFALFLGLMTALAVGTLAFELPVLIYQRRAGSRGRIRALPQSMVAGGGLVLASRLLSFQPGYAYGIIAGYEAEDDGLPPEQQGRAIALGALSALTVAVGAWFAWGAIDTSAEDSARFALLVLDAALAAIVVSGIQGVTFTLLPLSFMDGDAVMAWSRPVWAVLQGLAGFALFYIVLRPQSGFVDFDSSTPVFAMLVAFTGFSLFSILFWAYWRRQKAKESRRAQTRDFAGFDVRQERTPVGASR